jgi:ribose transport system substrate-binding protein
MNLAFDGMQAAAQTIDPAITVSQIGPTTWEPTVTAIELKQLVRSGKSRGVVAMVADERMLVGPINNAQKAGIPVITFDSDAPDSTRLTFSGTHNYNAGRVAGDTVAGWLEDGRSVGISTGLGPHHLAERVRGFKDAILAKKPGTQFYEIDDEIRENIAPTAAQLTALVKAHPNIQVFFSSHGNSGAAAAKAVADMGKSDSMDILAFDFQAPVVDLVKKKAIRGTVGQDPFMMGYISMILVHHAAGLDTMPSTHGEWRAEALQAFLDAHPELDARLRKKITAAMPTKGAAIDTGVHILDADSIEQAIEPFKTNVDADATYKAEER